MCAKSILVVDDEPLICQSIEMLLSKHGHIVETALTGSDALAMAGARHYHLVLTDMRMPGMSGSALATQLRMLNHQWKIVLLTGFPPGDVGPTFDGLILKPFSSELLVKTVSELLGGSVTREPDRPADSDALAPNLDREYLRAAESWVELRNSWNAIAELAKLSPVVDHTPEVLALRWHLHARSKDLAACLQVAQEATKAFPNDVSGWIALAQTFYYGGQVERAYQIAARKIGLFPDSWQLHYDLACYTSLLGKVRTAWYYLRRAMATGNAKVIKERARSDPDLQAVLEIEGL